MNDPVATCAVGWARKVEPMAKNKAHKATTRAIAKGRYREKRAYLADHVFMSAPGGKKEPDDLLPKKEWGQFMHLPTDVLLRTTDYLGSMVDDMLTQEHAWVTAMPTDPAQCPFMFDAALDAADEFAAAPFIAAHGWYRQATAALRNALEVMSHAARYAVQNDQGGHQSWRDGHAEPRFGNSLDLLHKDPAVAAHEASLTGATLFGPKPDGVLRALYAEVCKYAHSQPGYTNGDIWQSNGPVFVDRAFTRFWLDYCDTLLACYVLFKIGHPSLTLPKCVKSIPAVAGTPWHGVAEEAIRQYFP